MAAPLFLSAQETYPLTKYLGQFFEQGYGNEGDEENLDLAAEGQKLYHAGWSYNLQEGFDTTGVHFADYSQFNLDATFRLTDKIGEQQWQVRVPGPQDEVARGIIPSINPDFSMAAVVRQTDLYRPQEWVRPADQLYLYLLDAGGTYDPLYVHEEQGLAPVDIQTGENHYYVLANAMDENQFTYPTLLKISQTGNLIWQQNFKVEGMNVLSHELVVTENQELFFPVNYVDEGLAGVVGFNPAGQQLNDPQHVPTQAYLYGIAADGSNQLWTAGYEFSEPADTNALISRFTASGLYDQHWQKGNNQGQQKFRDLVLHDQGLQALGTRTDTTEGSASVYVSHLDNQVNEYYYDVMGSPNRDRVSSLILKPEAPVTTFAGRHTGYGVYESGNAYLGGILLGMNRTCVLPRIMYVDSFVTKILDNAGAESQLLNFCDNKKIDYILCYGINKIFDGSMAYLKSELNRFISDAKRNHGITVGMVGEYDNSNNYYNDAHQYNLDAERQRFNYDSCGKVNAVQNNWEFWNIEYDNISSFEDTINKYTRILSDLKDSAAQSANNWEVSTYIGRFHMKDSVNGDDPVANPFYTFCNNQQCIDNLQSWDTVVHNIEESSDALYFYYGTQYRFGDGLFLLNDDLDSANQTLTGFPMSGVEGNRQRKNLSVLGTGNLQRPTYYVPIFYNQYDDYILNGQTVIGCPKNNYNKVWEDKFGPWLEFFPPAKSQNPNPNRGNTFRAVEDTFLDQYNLIYQSYVNNGAIPGNNNTDPNIPLNNLNEVKIAGFAWFTYTCFQGKSFNPNSDNSLVPCRGSFSAPLSVDHSEIKHYYKPKNLLLSAFPNPSEEGGVNLKFNFPGRYKLDLYTATGHLTKSYKISLNKEEIAYISYDKKGFCFLRIRKIGSTARQSVKILFK